MSYTRRSWKRRKTTKGEKEQERDKEKEKRKREKAKTKRKEKGQECELKSLLKGCLSAAFAPRSGVFQAETLHEQELKHRSPLKPPFFFFSKAP